jgi:pyruvate/2-oxoglutarate dehydrogenase complex dihydrolipoamide dehydrogenase (E3) component
MRTFDAIIVGAGQAGPPLAGRLTAAGMTVAIIERKLVGGTCVNTGCTPTKTLIATARAAHIARQAAAYGVVVGGPVSVDMPRVKARADAVVAASRDGLRSWLAGMDRCTLIEGHARLESARSVRVGDEVLGAARIFLNVGARARIPAMPGVDEVPVLTNTTMVAMNTLPRHLVVVGGSYVGLEFAQMYRRFGSEVTVVEKGPRLIAREDDDVSEAVRGILEGEGITIRTAAKCIAFGKAEPGIRVDLDCEAGQDSVTGSHVLLAVGRQPNTEDLGLDRAGIAVDAHGYIVVDDQLRTHADTVWALGDCNGRGAFTHTAYDDFQIVAANLLDEEHRRVSGRLRGYALYIDPPLGRVGLTEREARATGRPFLIGRRPMTRVSRAVEKGETLGFIKILVDAQSDHMVGAAILGTDGDEAIHGILDVMTAGVPAATLRRSVPIHPTVSELIPTVLGDLVPAPEEPQPLASREPTKTGAVP